MINVAVSFAVSKRSTNHQALLIETIRFRNIVDISILVANQHFRRLSQ